MGKKKKQMATSAAQADPVVGEESDEDLFGDDDELAAVEDFAPELSDAHDDLATADNFFVRPSFEGLPLNQVPGKLRKFLNQKD